MENFYKPEGQTTSDNFVVSDNNNDFGRPESLWGELSEQDVSYLLKKGFKTPQELLKSYRELEKAYSLKISLPKDGDKEALDKLYSRLGMPEDSEKYVLRFAKEDIDDGEAFKQVCLQNYILPKSAQALYDWYVKHRQELMENEENSWLENSNREFDETKRRWGARAARNLELVKRGVRMFSHDNDIVFQIEKAIGTKRMLEVFCRLGEAISEDNSVSFGGSSNAHKEWDPVEYFREMFKDK